jgi:mono/diheme cytochrome c family protein
MKKTLLLGLFVVAFILFLGVLLLRPPAWATPLPQVAGATQPAWDAASAVADASIMPQVASSLAQQADTPSSDNCIACHTDKKKLKAVAEEPEEVKSEKASGEG